MYTVRATLNKDRLFGWHCLPLSIGGSTNQMISKLCSAGENFYVIHQAPKNYFQKSVHAAYIESGSRYKKNLIAVCNNYFLTVLSWLSIPGSPCPILSSSSVLFVLSGLGVLPGPGCLVLGQPVWLLWLC
jgi:hypothetical protein